MDHVVEFDKYTEPMKGLLDGFRRAAGDGLTWSRRRIRAWWTASPPRIRAICRSGRTWRIRARRYLAEIAARLAREIPRGQPVHFPVNAVLAGRRNNPPDPKVGLPPLAVYNPIHYQELPELFMDFISSLTGKSSVDDRVRQRRRADQGAVQRAVAGGGSEQRAGVVRS